MTRRHAALAAAWVLAAASVVFVVIGIVRLIGDGSGDGSDDASSGPRSGGLDAAVRSATPARAPFDGATATRITVGSRRVHAVVADTEAEREQGLRGRDTLAPYEAMLFVFPAPTRVAFTMATVPVALDIGFYDAAGSVVDRLRMEPCAGTDASCPLYRARGPFRYALEAIAPRLPRGRVAA